MNRLLITLIATAALCTTLTSPATANAYDAKQFRFSGLLGQVGLLGDPGEDGANGLGFGFSGAYQLDEKLALELRYLRSSHSDVNHTDISVGAEYFFSDYENAYPHAQAGMSFLNNEFKGIGFEGDAVGIYIGGGLAFEINRSLQIGPEVRFVKAFSSEARVANQTVTTVGDNYSLLLRLQYILGEE